MNTRELLDILACPACRGPLGLLGGEGEKEPKGFVCERCRLLYPIEKGIPVMLIDRAIPLDAPASQGGRQ